MDNKLIAALMIFNFSVIGLLTYHIVRKYVKPEQGITAKQIKFKNLILMLLPQVVLLAGAFLARVSGHLLLPFASSIILSMAVITANTYFLEDYKFVQESSTTGRIGYVLTRLVPFTFLYFFFLFAVYGFKFDKMRTLFN